jgi:hypothetical protein
MQPERLATHLFDLLVVAISDRIAAPSSSIERMLHAIPMLFSMTSF